MESSRTARSAAMRALASGEHARVLEVGDGARDRRPAPAQLALDAVPVGQGDGEVSGRGGHGVPPVRRLSSSIQLTTITT